MPFVRLSQIDVRAEDVGIAITDGEFGAHVGILYCEQGPKVLHMLGHLKVRAEELAVCLARSCWIARLVDIPAYAQKHFAAILQAVARSQPQIPFGLNLLAARGSFDPHGQYTAPAGSDGLTCASFVSEVFRSAALDIVDETTWPVALENMEWGNRVIELLQRLNAKPEHIAAVRDGFVGLRLHPFEVGAASARSFAEWPIQYTVAHDGMRTVVDLRNDLCADNVAGAVARVMAAIQRRSAQG